MIHLLVGLFIIILTYQSINTLIPHYLLIPSQDWKQKISKVIEYPKPIYLKVGHKRSSFRRRLILASKCPSFYNNYTNNKLKIYPDDYTADFINEMRRRDLNDPNRKLLIGFFHPYANNGGGGEKVLWQAIKATQLANDKNICVVYTVNHETPKDILHKTKEKFNLEFDSSRIVFIYTRKFNNLIDGKYWKNFTIIGQLLGTVLLTLESIFELSPDVFIDTQGLPSSYLVVSWNLKIPIMSYTHYPILQQDMFNKLKVNSPKNLIKFAYWKLLYYFYVYLGTKIDITLANGTWTYNHLCKIWSWNKYYKKKIEILYPPCGDFIDSTSDKKLNRLLYVAQFRPEKRHDLILKEYKIYLQKQFPNIDKPTDEIPTIVFAGSTKNDFTTLDYLKKKVDELELSQFVEFIVDSSYNKIIELVSTCKFGINGMWNEHFGIGVVEYLSKGCIPIVHASAGPLLDIVTGEEIKDWYNEAGLFFKCYEDPDFKGVEKDGFLQFDNKSYPTFSKLLELLIIEDINFDQISSNGLKLVDKFSNKQFNIKWINYINELDVLEKKYREERRSKLEQVY
ncbi:unnamed protein product [Candida verbasci]|uniref:GDP-Man:Man(3)GlcNAc(2)-PP-Dol alpha-1,2-mannosyltransferase n=1 Tax=Candida verbasci TaxID=1227364 RepID=A0A9W4XIT9_9ASCO|nr:unnamed protein product [Candida verbasci]